MLKVSFWPLFSHEEPLWPHNFGTIDRYTQIQLVSCSPEHCLTSYFEGKVSIMCPSFAAASFLGRPLSQRSSTCLFRRARTADLDTSVYFEISAEERPCWYSLLTLSFSAVANHEVWPVTLNVFHILILVVESCCSSHSSLFSKPLTQLFLFQLMTVFQPTWTIDGH